MRGRRLPVTVLGIALFAIGACSWARPVTYPIPSGISASFAPSLVKASVEYAKTFCSVLAEPTFAREGWEACDHYVKMQAATPAGTLATPESSWTLLLIGGFGAQCFGTDVVAFEDAAKHLRDTHSIGFHHIEVDAFSSSERNAEIIRDKVGRLTESRFIVIAHSKGAADIMVALTKYPTELQRIKAFVTVAGAIAVSGKHNTSKILRPLWNRLRPYGLEQDSHIVERESVVPGGVFLGRALADHWAVAMPFYGNDKVRKEALHVINHNRYPRPALIEAAVRTVIKDLSAPPT